jgi:allantoinase
MSHDAHLNRDFVGYGGKPPHPQWPNGARLALNIVINFEEGSEPSYPDGDEMTETRLSEGGGGFKGRDLAAESMFEYGSRIGFWRINRLLAERGMTATIFACALALERNAPACEEIKARAYDVCSHGWRWERHQDLTEEQERERISRAVESLKRTLGQAPAGWYCRYGPSVNTRRLIVENGSFLYDSDAYNDELPYWTKVLGKDHLVLPYSLANNDGKFISGAVATAQDFFESLRDGFDMLYREGATQPKMMSVGLHQRVVGHASRAAGLERFLDHVAKHSDVWVCGRSDIARHWAATHPPPNS